MSSRRSWRTAERREFLREKRAKEMLGDSVVGSREVDPGGISALHVQPHVTSRVGWLGIRTGRVPTQSAVKSRARRSQFWSRGSFAEGAANGGSSGNPGARCLGRSETCHEDRGGWSSVVVTQGLG